MNQTAWKYQTMKAHKGLSSRKYDIKSKYQNIPSADFFGPITTHFPRKQRRLIICVLAYALRISIFLLLHKRCQNNLRNFFCGHSTINLINVKKRLELEFCHAQKLGHTKKGLSAELIKLKKSGPNWKAIGPRRF